MIHASAFSRSLRFFPLVFVLACSLLTAADAGLTGGAFLKIPVGGRMVGMAEAFTAVADDPYALAGNVAGISRNRDLEISFSHLEWFGDVNCEFLAFTKSFFKGIGGFDSTLGLALQYLHVPDFAQYNDWGESIGTARFSDYLVIAGYGQAVGPVNAGVALKYVNEASLGKGDGALTFNFGLLYSLRLPAFKLFKRDFIACPLDFGFLLENWSMGTRIGGFATPTLWKLGVAFRPVDPFLLAVDLQLTPENRLRLNTGLEYSLNNMFYFRFGYRFFGYDSDSYTMGLGARFTIAGKIIKADLSFAPASVLGNTIGLSLSMKYPGRISDEDRKTADVLYYRGIYYFTLGDLEKAVEMWRLALKFDPEMEQARVKIEQALKLKELEGIEKKVEEKMKEKPPATNQ